MSDSSRASGKRLISRLSWLLVLAPLGALPMVNCAKVQDNTPSDTGGTFGGTGGAGGTGGTIRPNTGGAFQPPMGCNGKCTDFPTEPIFDMGTPTSAADGFSGTATDGAMPCITEPQDGSMFPSNWLRPRIAFSGNKQVAKITLHSEAEANDLVAYTNKATWTLPKDIWTQLASHASDVGRISVTVRIGNQQSTVKFEIAPVPATGSMVFWSADPAVTGKDQATCASKPASCENDSYLQGFAVGDESVGTVLKLGQVEQKSRNPSGDMDANVSCIGCHSGTPDDAFVTFVDNYDWRGVVASVKPMPTLPGRIPQFLKVGGRQALLQPGWGPFTFPNAAKAPTLWTGTAGAINIGVASLGSPDLSKSWHGNEPDSNAAPSLAWVNFSSTTAGTGNEANWIYVSFAKDSTIDSGNAVGLMTLMGDPNGGAAFPSFKHDGSEVVYASTHGALSGRLNINDGKSKPGAGQLTEHGMPGSTDLYTVPFNMGKGGKVSPVMGAATKEFEEYLGSYSPDDQLIAFNKVPAGQTMYANPNAELFVTTAAGGTPVRIGANDPPSCSAKKSPGINNVWARWAPSFTTSGSLTYYFLIFSSNRAGTTVTVKDNRDPKVSPTAGQNITVSVVQLYMTVITINETGTITSYPAIYLWNQEPSRLNLTPAWSTFEIPPIG